MLKYIIAVVVILFVFVLVARKTSSPVYVERSFPAPAEKIWGLWNDPEAIKKWWSPKDYTAPIIKNDFRVGGSYLFSMKSPKNQMMWNSGIYKEIVPNKKIVSTMSFSDENGKAFPGDQVAAPGEWPDEITITVEFKEVDGNTTVAITEVGIPLIMKILAKMGWEQQFDKFEKLL